MHLIWTRVTKWVRPCIVHAISEMTLKDFRKIGRFHLPTPIPNKLQGSDMSMDLCIISVCVGDVAEVKLQLDTLFASL